MVDNKKSSFINILRGIATLLVLYCHWGYGFFVNNEQCADMGYFIPIQWGNKPFFSSLSSIIEKNIGLNPGMMGVGLFFLISGFLVMNSLNNRTWSEFIITRIIRIYPVYAVCLAITCIIIYCSAYINSLQFRVNLSTYLINASLTRLWFWSPGIDGVVWTLEIEMFFYIIASVVSLRGGQIYNLRSIAIIDFVSVSFIYIIHGFYTDLAIRYMYLYKTLFTVGHFLVFMPYILLGVILRLKKDNTIDRIQFFFFFFLQMAVFFMNIYYFYPELFKEYAMSYSFMLVIFVLAMYLSQKEKNLKSKILEKIAEISFPFYALHGAAGYAVLAFFYYHLNNLVLTYIISLVLFILCSYLVHITVERFTRKVQVIVSNKIW